MTILNEVLKDASFFSIPRSWTQYILHTNFRMDGKPDWNQILVLADIVYNMRYAKSRILSGADARPGYTPEIVLGVDDIANNVNLTKNQVTDALFKLIAMGIVSKRYKSLKTSSGTVPKASLLCLNISLLQEITEQDIAAKKEGEKTSKNSVSYEAKKGRTEEVFNKVREVCNSETGNSVADNYTTPQNIPKEAVTTLGKPKPETKSNLSDWDDDPPSPGGGSCNDSKSQFDTKWIYAVCRRTGIIAQKQAMTKIKTLIATRYSKTEIENCLLWYSENYHLLRNHSSLPNLYGFVQWFGDIMREFTHPTIFPREGAPAAPGVW